MLESSKDVEWGGERMVAKGSSTSKSCMMAALTSSKSALFVGDGVEVSSVSASEVFAVIDVLIGWLVVFESRFLNCF